MVHKPRKNTTLFLGSFDQEKEPRQQDLDSKNNQKRVEQQQKNVVPFPGSLSQEKEPHSFLVFFLGSHLKFLVYLTQIINQELRGSVVANGDT